VSAKLRKSARKARTDQVGDEEEDVLPGLVVGRFGWAGGPDSSAVAVCAVAYCGHCDVGGVYELDSSRAVIRKSRSRSRSALGVPRCLYCSLVAGASAASLLEPSSRGLRISEAR
jgi:hypothetical protein